MGFQRTDVEALSSALGEPGWVLDSRLAAWETFRKLELPGEKDEPWRYTDLRRLRFNLDNFRPISPDPGRQITDRQLELIQEEQSRAGYVIQRDTDVVKVELDADLAKSGVILTDLGTAIREYPELVRPHLYSLADHSGHIFDALQVALSSGGTFLYVPRGVTVELPIESQRWIDEPGCAVFPRTLVVVQEGAEVTYIERLRSTELESPSLCNAAVEVFAGQASRVNLVTLQEFGPQVWHFANNRYKTERDVNLRSLILTLGSRFSRNEAGTVIGEGSSIEMLGLYFAGPGQHFDFRTLQDHAAPRGFSDLLYKGALKGDARTVYSGLIHVRPEGAETDAYQTNRNIVLSDDARADSKPELEIENNDVRCSHAASVGQLNEEEIFYLTSRGIPRDEAESLIIKGFFEEVVGRFGNDELRDVLSSAIERKLVS